ncbi:MAG: hypothetical protein OEV85_12340 [Candidatus Thorarchaeota archaeon]|nr:hypothetical protein [Candidatus Thorarchaeota archaeon]
MTAADEQAKVSRTLKYSSDEAAAVFRIAWYMIASKPNVLLEEYSEGEGQDFNGMARFSLKIAGEDGQATIRLDGEQSSLEIDTTGMDEVALGMYVSGFIDSIKDAINKYQSLPEADRGRLRRALMAKTCWDRMVREILNKAPMTNVYYQVAHGREMIIKAIEGDPGVYPITLTTSAWLSQMEPHPKNETLPGFVASELAKKSVEWKRETQEIISRYI